MSVAHAHMHVYTRGGERLTLEVSSSTMGLGLNSDC